MHKLSIIIVFFLINLGCKSRLESKVGNDRSVSGEEKKQESNLPKNSSVDDSGDDSKDSNEETKVDSAKEDVLPPKVNSLSLGELQVMELNGGQIKFSFAYSGDDNSNSETKIFFCSVMTASGCEPKDGELITFLKLGDKLEAIVDVDTTLINPGDFLKYVIETQDLDGSEGGVEEGFVFVPLDYSSPRGINQLNRAVVGLQHTKLDFSDDEYINAIAIDEEGYLYLGGKTKSSVFEPIEDGFDFLIAKLTPDGSLDGSFGNLGVVHLGLISAGGSRTVDALALDGAGNLYVVGGTTGNFGGVNAGNSDGYIAKINATTGAFDTNFGNGDGKDNDGILQLNDTLISGASSNDWIDDMILDNQGGLYFAGRTFGSLGGTHAGGADVFIGKINLASGQLDASFGSGDGKDGDGLLQINNSFANSAVSSETINALLLDGSGALFFAGDTWGDFGGPNTGGDLDAYAAKINAATGVFDTTFGDGDGNDDDGILQLNNAVVDDATDDEYVRGLSMDASSNLFLAGYTRSSFGGPLAGMADGYIAKINSVTGVLDTVFGDGDGNDDDGVLQLNNSFLGTAADLYEQVSSIAIDSSGQLFVAGLTQGNMGGANAGWNDVFIAKINSVTGIVDAAFGDGDGQNDDGITQLNDSNTQSASDYEYSEKILFDGEGNLVLTGRTSSSLGGWAAGKHDFFVAKIETSSGLLVQSFGAEDFSDGTGKGIRQLNEIGHGTTFGREYVYTSMRDDAGNLYIAGSTDGSLGGANAGNQDAFIAKFNANSGELDSDFGFGDGINGDGILQFNHLIGMSADGNDMIQSMTFDVSGNVIVAGDTTSALGGVNSGGRDAFIAKVDPTTGALITTFGSGDGNANDGILQLNDSISNSASGTDIIYAVVVDDTNQIYIAGTTQSALGGAYAGNGDAFIAKIDSLTGGLDSTFGDGDGNDDDGILQLNNSIVNSANLFDGIKSLALSSSGHLFAAGETGSNLGASNDGLYDGFIAKINKTSGVFDTVFGDGDGNDNDGVLQLNNSQTLNAGGDDVVYAMVLDDAASQIYIAGKTKSNLGGPIVASYDGFIAKIHSGTGAFDTTFGDGDGNNDDGIIQLNNNTASDANGDDWIHALVLNGTQIFAAGNTTGALGGPAAGGDRDGFVLKVDKNSGVFDPAFGDGDGNDDDGIMQINNSKASSTDGADNIRSLVVGSEGQIFVSGFTASDLGGSLNGPEDGFVIQCDSNTGVIPTN